MADQKTILLADDDIVIREMYRERLSHEGFTVIEAKDGEEALDLATSHHPDLVLLDIMMPKVNGLDVLAQLKRQQETKHIPVIVLTALVSEMEKVKEMNSDFVDFVVKAETTPGGVVAKVKQQFEPVKKDQPDKIA